MLSRCVACPQLARWPPRFGKDVRGYESYGKGHLRLAVPCGSGLRGAVGHLVPCCPEQRCFGAPGSSFLPPTQPNPFQEQWCTWEASRAALRDVARDVDRDTLQSNASVWQNILAEIKNEGRWCGSRLYSPGCYAESIGNGYSLFFYKTRHRRHLMKLTSGKLVKKWQTCRPC